MNETTKANLYKQNDVIQKNESNSFGQGILKKLASWVLIVLLKLNSV